ncbi:zinc-dependent peptidase [Winogradskyella endarachnes]|uniref:Zinc-dependent peptidase n=1 Tax=Winogradskyella endarachnes TaxID=2681965 RepID=A0A6L6UDD3_9FLAO|nr:zinc-dependent peptidase [Winogradskyella endarachnes]MUU78867.1 hypothetical protein [Winogradskyella endarachnes]
MILKTEEEVREFEVLTYFIVPSIVVLILLFIFYRLFKLVQIKYADKYSKPIFNHVYLLKKELAPNHRLILQQEHSFYNKLSKKNQVYFEHRVNVFINNKEFIGKQELIVTEYMKVLIAATATMLTFGFKKYTLDLINKVIIYPESYYSQINDTYHKGETNPKLKTIVFSWKDFLHGYKIGNDNLNLGIHEFGHAIHLNATSSNDISSYIFNRGFKNLISYLQNNEEVRKELIASKYFRAYAFTNHFEFFAVLLENFVETPENFKFQFPQLYKYMQDMLNFKFAGY